MGLGVGVGQAARAYLARGEHASEVGHVVHLVRVRGRAGVRARVRVRGRVRAMAIGVGTWSTGSGRSSPPGRRWRWSAESPHTPAQR